jgi:hypothetical protein
MFLSVPYRRSDNEERKGVVTLAIVKREEQTYTWEKKKEKNFFELPSTVKTAWCSLP